MRWYKFHEVPLYLTSASAKLLRSVGACEPMDGRLYSPKAETITEAQIKNWLATAKDGHLNMNKLFEYM
jgi:hypothetical protein